MSTIRNNITYTHKVGKDGFVRHTPCWYVICMTTASEGIRGAKEGLATLYRDKIDNPELKDYFRWSLKDSEKYYRDSERAYNNHCVGSRECIEEDILKSYEK